MTKFLSGLLGGLMTGLFCVALGVSLHSCTQPVIAAEPGLERAAEMAAQAEILKLEAEYEAMSEEAKMEGIVYE